jgi:hypothetical protein
VTNPARNEWPENFAGSKPIPRMHVSVKDLEADIMKFVAYHNENPKPYKWAKSADEILASVKRFCLKAEQKLCGEL